MSMNSFQEEITLRFKEEQTDKEINSDSSGKFLSHLKSIKVADCLETAGSNSHY